MGRVKKQYVFTQNEMDDEKAMDNDESMQEKVMDIQCKINIIREKFSDYFANSGKGDDLIKRALDRFDLEGAINWIHRTKVQKWRAKNMKSRGIDKDIDDVKKGLNDEWICMDCHKIIHHYLTILHIYNILILYIMHQISSILTLVMY